MAKTLYEEFGQRSPLWEELTRPQVKAPRLLSGVPVREYPGVREFMDKSVLEPFQARLAQLREVLPRTVGNAQGIVPIVGEKQRALANFLPLDPASSAYTLGLRGDTSRAVLENEILRHQAAGWYPQTVLPGAIESLAQHETGHALNRGLYQYAHGESGLTGQKLMDALNRTQGQLIAEARSGDISGYAKIASKNATENLKGLYSQAAEPFAEQFAKNPAYYDELLGTFKRQGFRGAATPELMMRGAGAGAAMLAAPIVAHFLAPKNELVRQAAEGGAAGSMFGLPGAAAGAVANPLLHRLFGIGL